MSKSRYTEKNYNFLVNKLVKKNYTSGKILNPNSDFFSIKCQI